MEIVEILVSVGRCTKVTKGGRNFSFSTIVVVGDKNGRVGYGLGKASEVIDAKAKAAREAKRNMIKIPLRDGRTLHHDVAYKYCASKVILRAAPAGKGVIAGSVIRAVCDALGIKDIVTKSLRSNNPHNLIKATIGALKSIRSPKMIADQRSKTVSEIASLREYH